MASSSSPPIGFSSTESLSATTMPTPPRRQHLLSFRRISLLSSQALVNRQSTASLASFQSLPETGLESSGTPTSGINPANVLSSRPFLDVSRKGHRRCREVQRTDDAKETKKRQVIAEFYDTERAYVNGLDLIYTHFLTPTIESLDTPSPLLERPELTSVFSNFIDIWNLHHAFLDSLKSLLSSCLDDPRSALPALSSIFISHFPYLSLYTPFVSTFPNMVAKLETSSAFVTFVKQQECSERCGNLKLRDWLLTIVQRCPRYRLLLRDLISCTDREDLEHARLLRASSILAKVTSSLDTSLQTQAETLALLALQRSTPNLPIQLVSPGRTLLKRGALTQLDQSSLPQLRDFLLFNDCLVWLMRDRSPDNDWHRSNDAARLKFRQRPQFKRTRSKSENEIPVVNDRRNANARKQQITTIGGDEKWMYKGKIDLIDLQLVLSPGRNFRDDRRLELLSPELSFAAYAESEDERNDWANAIRLAKSSLLASLNVMHPNSTLASSASTNHLRRSLQALPYPPEEDENLPRREKVDHFVPAIWVPDGRTNSCMRCGRTFNWRRRRHHCRLCGRCVCAQCSERTFVISDPIVKENRKSARACNACYETVFPVLDQSAEHPLPQAVSGSTLASFPSWKTTQPSYDAPKPSVLMSLDSPSRRRERSQDADHRTKLEVVRKARPLSHPCIPVVFQDALTAPAVATDEEPESDDGMENSPRFHQPMQFDFESTPPSRVGSVPSSPVQDTSPKNRKRFSMPAIALQTTPVTARTNASGKGRSRRYSLVLNGRRGTIRVHPQARNENSELVGGDRHGVAAAKLAEILEKTRAFETN